MNADGLVDLHTHSDCSDGVLSPQALVAAAAARGVQLLALTDHDTTRGCEGAGRACVAAGMGFVQGAELTSLWCGREVHIVGLALDPGNASLQTHCAEVIGLRRARIVAIAQRLTRAGLPGERLAAQALEFHAPTRAHLARALCALGLAKDNQAAFDRYLKHGRPGHVPPQWPPLVVAVQRIVAAGGLPVLAHPHRYRVSAGGLRELVAEFKAAGGRGIEVSVTGMGPGEADRSATLARRYELAGSIGSDFHEPGLAWRPLGRFAKLPDRVTPITTLLAPMDTGRSQG
ncbi:MAG: PHP domain-containing protein [Steroidobacteraceae bacterium]